VNLPQPRRTGYETEHLLIVFRSDLEHVVACYFHEPNKVEADLEIMRRLATQLAHSWAEDPL
jgi:hypothetical protein